MGHPVIRAVGLGKEYLIGAREAHETFRDMLTASLAAPFRRLTRLSGRVAPTERVWALKDVGFEVGEGEVVGVIGRNGAGKTTLLKILARITEPTEGRVEIRGRVSSLLEVGTGFHPELTGRENIYLNGAILGMSRAEIDRKFDEIVAFAEVERFLDTPVKRYSSGMAVRLAFAVAAHLEPEILLVDEVLAVGDAAFQRKCLGKMQEVSGQGRTVLFVSHNMLAVQQLSGKGIILDSGKVAFEGDISNAITMYRQQVFGTISEDLKNRQDRKGNGKLRFTEYWFSDPSGVKLSTAITGQELFLNVGYEATEKPKNATFAFNLYEDDGYVLVNFSSADTDPDFASIPTHGILVCRIPKLPLKKGRYFGNLFATFDGQIADWIHRAISLDVDEGDFHGTGRLNKQGRFAVEHSWYFEELAHLEDPSKFTLAFKAEG